MITDLKSIVFVGLNKSRRRVGSQYGRNRVAMASEETQDRRLRFTSCP
jgi:hypothetical protein